MLKESYIIKALDEKYDALLNARANGKSFEGAKYDDERIASIKRHIEQLKRNNIVETSCYGEYLFFIDINGLEIKENEDGWEIE